MGLGGSETGGVALPRITILDEATANRIAAGEVVERPASAVKELLENSLDAGADKIDAEITGGGLKSITVVDNGCGMDVEDAKLAFLRHATSKILYAQDLENIQSLGFRGEALPSIAAVSRVIMKTRPPESYSGTALEMQGGHLLSVIPTGCPAGTSIQVVDLFYNTPARRKHMKSVYTEAGLVSDVVTRTAMSRPSAGIRLFNNGRLAFQSDGSGRLLNVLASVYGPEIAGMMLPVYLEQDGITIDGFITGPGVHRSSRRHINIFVNGRYIRNYIIVSAITEACQTIIPQGRFPLAAISLILNPETVDVNIHPSKMEIKITGEQNIYRLIKSAVQKALFTPVIIPVEKNIEFPPPEPAMSGTLEGKGLRVSPAGEEDRLCSPNGSSKLILNEEKFAYVGTPIPFQSPSPDPLFPVFTAGGGNSSPPLETTEAGNTECSREDLIISLYPIGFLPPTYMLCGGREGLYILDQHAAHERILFEKFYDLFNAGNSGVQYLLIPQTLHLSHREAEIARSNMDFLRKLSINIEDFGGETMILRGVPSGLPEGSEKSFVLDVLEQLVKPAKTVSSGSLHFAAAAAAACSAAIKSGTKSSPAETAFLLKELAAAKNLYTCPHGRPTIICISTTELSSRFKRT